MKIELLDEPELQFGYGNHIDIRYGIANWSPFDVEDPLAPKSIKLAIVGTSQTIEEVMTWFERCREAIPAKLSNKPMLFPKFCGFNDEVGFRSRIVLNDTLNRQVTPHEFEVASTGPEKSRIIQQISAIFLREIRLLTDKNPDVIICAPPVGVVEVLLGSLPTKTGEDEEPIEDENTGEVDNFRRYLKATVMQYRIPIQILLPHTYNDKVRYSSDVMKERRVQDHATRAWNICTALYYKANGTPWRLKMHPTEFTTCFVGISFYKSQSDTTLQTSVAQVFNERGKGVILRGGKAATTKENPRPHLDEGSARILLLNALQRYREEHGTSPARIVLHKSSKYSPEEYVGFKSAAQEKHIDRLDLLTVFKSSLRLYRTSLYPPLRGTYCELDSDTSLLYTRGSVEFFETYPGLYIPRALEIRCAEREETPKKLCEEVLALTKMNWNNTQFDGGLPITLKCSRQVGDILKYVTDDSEIEHRYSFYM